MTRQLESPLVAILVFAALVSILVGDWTDASIVLVILLGSALLGFVQEHRASLALERLRSRVRVRATVMRDGEPRSVPPEELVPGDVIALAAGSLVPGDGVVLEARDLFATEAALTGEAFPVEKRPGAVSAAASLAERANCVFMGTSVRSGTARALVVRTGEATVFGGIAARLRLRPPETEFERGIRQYGYLLMRITVLVVLLVFGAQFVLERPPIESLLFRPDQLGVRPADLCRAVVAVGRSRRSLPNRMVIAAHGAGDRARRANSAAGPIAARPVACSGCSLRPWRHSRSQSRGFPAAAGSSSRRCPRSCC